MLAVRCAPTLTLSALAGLPRIDAGADLPASLSCALFPLSPRDGDVLVVASKLVSRAEGRFVALAGVQVGPEAAALARETDKDPRLVELILRESVSVSRKAKGVLIVRHRRGFVSANAGIDLSNALPRPDAVGEHALLLPSDPDASAERLAHALRERLGARIAVVISDSHGRPFRLGSVGVALGAFGLPVQLDHQGRVDLHGRPLTHTVTALADQVASAADLVMGQADEARGAVLVRGLAFADSADRAASLVRDPAQDLYA